MSAPSRLTLEAGKGAEEGAPVGECVARPTARAHGAEGRIYDAPERGRREHSRGARALKAKGGRL